MDRMLHLLMTPQLDVAAACRDMSSEGDTVVLTDCGVGLLAIEDFQADSAGVTWVALEADVEARGLKSLASERGIELINDQDWVDLAISHLHVLSWK